MEKIKNYTFELNGQNHDVTNIVWEYIITGRKIHTIKRIRETVGCSIKEARDFVYAMSQIVEHLRKKFLNMPKHKRSQIMMENHNDKH